MVIPKIKISRFVISLFSVILIITTLGGFLGFIFFFIPGYRLYHQLTPIKNNALILRQAISNKNLTRSQAIITELKSQISQFDKRYRLAGFIGSLPYLRAYFQDGLAAISIAQNGLEVGEIIIGAVEPYQDFLGLKSESTSSGQTAQDRITFLTQSVESLAPHLGTIQTRVAEIENLLKKIDANRYPQTFNNLEIKPNILKAQSTVSEIHKIIRDGQPILNQTSWLLGKNQARHYLILFQNDAELRPSGGFWTAYAILKVDKGKITPLVSDDIYALDAKFNSRIPAPRPIKAYHLDVPYFNLRDMNLSPDFPTDAKLFLDNYYQVAGSKDKIDAVIALDTHVLVDLVKILGRVGVFGWGNFSADPDKRCDGCPQIIYQLEWIAGRPRNYLEKDRKGFLGPLMNSLLANAMGSEKGKIGPLVETAMNNIYQKHILFYFTDPDIQKSAKMANIAGEIVATDDNTDYLHLNDANMASAKTNLFLQQKIKHEIISQNGKVEHKVMVTYINPSRASNCNLEKGDLCLNAPKYRNWFRFYVPRGSQLVKMTGSEVEPVKYEELDKQVFEGFYGNKYPLYPQSSSKVSVQYISSTKLGSDYNLLIQKQPGTKPIEYELIVNGEKVETFTWTNDRTLKIPL